MSPVDDRSKPVNLVLLTNHFPYGRGEEFLQNEFPFYSGRFQKIIVISKNTVDPIRAEITEFLTYRVDAKGDWFEYFIVCSQLVRKLFKVIKVLHDELKFLRSHKLFSAPILGKMLHDLFKALTKSYHIEHILRKEKLKDRVVLYSYWLDSTALATLFVNGADKSVVRISRAHGGDVYSFRHPHNYLSFRKTLVRYLDRIFTISDDANVYLRESTEVRSANSVIVTSRLGTRRGEKKVVDLSPAFHIVSCSYLVPVKQIDLLIKALSLLQLEVRWTHIGDGPLKQNLQQLASSLLRNHQYIRYEFLGNLSNAEVLQFYQSNSVHLFINCSKTEGIPVTMMEAQSFGIPVVAPEVGGIPEIISNDTGALFTAGASAEIVAAKIEKVLTMSNDDYLKMRAKSYENWFTRYNAEKNFPTFVDKILSIEK